MSKKTAHNLRDFHLPNAILSYAAFFRYFIADEVIEDRVLYLDSDTIVNAKLDDLFYLDLQGYAIAAVQDFDQSGWLTTFNSGVMVIDTKKWRENRLTQSLLELTAQHMNMSMETKGFSICISVTSGYIWTKSIISWLV